MIFTTSQIPTNNYQSAVYLILHIFFISLKALLLYREYYLDVTTTQTFIINQTLDKMKPEKLKKWIELVIAVLAAIAGTLSASAMM